MKVNVKIESSDLFFCYTPKLFGFLQYDNKINAITRQNKNGISFSVFQMDKRLKRALKEFDAIEKERQEKKAFYDKRNKEYEENRKKE